MSDLFRRLFVKKSPAQYHMLRNLMAFINWAKLEDISDSFTQVLKQSLYNSFKPSVLEIQAPLLNAPMSCSSASSSSTERSEYCSKGLNTIVTSLVTKSDELLRVAGEFSGPMEKAEEQISDQRLTNTLYKNISVSIANLGLVSLGVSAMVPVQELREVKGKMETMQDMLKIIKKESSSLLEESRANREESRKTLEKILESLRIIQQNTGGVPEKLGIIKRNTGGVPQTLSIIQQTAGEVSEKLDMVNENTKCECTTSTRKPRSKSIRQTSMILRNHQDDSSFSTHTVDQTRDSQINSFVLQEKREEPAVLV